MAVAVLFAQALATVGGCGKSAEPGPADAAGGTGGAPAGGGRGADASMPGARSDGPQTIPDSVPPPPTVDAGRSPADAGSPPADAASPGNATQFLEQCFAGLTLSGSFQDASRATADGRYRMRLALQVPPDTGGTSGTFPWRAVRVGLVTPRGSICIRAGGPAQPTYTVSHHNCKDVLQIPTDTGLRYVVENPDSAFDYLDHTKFRRVAKLSAYAGDQLGEGPLTFETVVCHRGGSPGGLCGSGGPCQ
jgi:hypothetical protein